jgi:hypothetical protein
LREGEVRGEERQHTSVPRLAALLPTKRGARGSIARSRSRFSPRPSRRLPTRVSASNGKRAPSRSSHIRISVRCRHRRESRPSRASAALSSSKGQSPVRTLAGDVLRPPVVMAVIDGVLEQLTPRSRDRELQQSPAELQTVEREIGTLRRPSPRATRTTARGAPGATRATRQVARSHRGARGRHCPVLRPKNNRAERSAAHRRLA